MHSALAVSILSWPGSYLDASSALAEAQPGSNRNASATRTEIPPVQFTQSVYGRLDVCLGISDHPARRIETITFYDKLTEIGK